LPKRDGRLEVLGIQCGIVKTVREEAPSQDSVILCLHSWEPERLRELEYLGKGSLIHSYMSTLCVGQIKESVPASSFLTVKQCQEAYTDLMAPSSSPVEDEWSRTQFLLEVERKIRGRSLFHTENYIGLCISSTKPGKLLFSFVLLFKLT
jgi:hypothetical protein